jgi:hypothetical protein
MPQPDLTREGIAVALFSILQGIQAKTCSRIWKVWTDVQPEEHPALFLTKAPEHPAQDQSGLPTVWKVEYLVHIYCYSTDEQAPASTAVNQILDALEAALKPTTFGMPGLPGSVQVLGDRTGAIQHAWISGSIETDEGLLGPQSVAIVPIEVQYTA